MTRSNRSFHRVGSIVSLLISVTAFSLFGQDIRIAALSLGARQPARLLEVARAVARFDVVAADGIGEAGDMEKVLAGMDDRWEAVLNGAGGYYGFFYDERLEVVKELGTYRGSGRFPRPPYGVLAERVLAYGVQFRLARSRFAFNLVACRVAARDTAGLADVSRWFERLTGNRGITILAARFEDGQDPTRGQLFPGTAFRSRLGRSGVETFLPHLAYLTLRAGQGS